MKRLAWIAIVALLLAPADAGAAKKSILRFKKATKEAKPAPPVEKEGRGPLLIEKSPLLGGSSQEGWLLRPEGDEGRLLGEMVKRPDWFGEKFPAKPRRAGSAGAATQAASDETEAAMPGTPAESAPIVGVPPRREPVIRRGVRYLAPPPQPSPLPGLGSEERPGTANLPSLPARPQEFVPFTYQVTPPNVGTPGYAPNVAPRGEPRLPSAAPIVTGQPPPMPRELPRLAPYGTALPPDQTEPPSALPR